MQGFASYWIGILQGGLEVLNCTVEVTVRAVNLPSATARVIWAD